MNRINRQFRTLAVPIFAALLVLAAVAGMAAERDPGAAPWLARSWAGRFVWSSGDTPQRVTLQFFKIARVAGGHIEALGLARFAAEDLPWIDYSCVFARIDEKTRRIEIWELAEQRDDFVTDGSFQPSAVSRQPTANGRGLRAEG